MVEYDRTRVIRFGKTICAQSLWRGSHAKFCKSCSCVLFQSLKARLVSKVSSSGGLHLRYSRCVCRAMLFGWCERGSGGFLRARCVPSLVKVCAREGANARCKSPTTG